MRILLIVPAAYSWRFPGLIYPHSGIAYLVAVLKRTGIQVNVLDMRLRAHAKSLIRSLDVFRPNLVGLTVYSDYYQRVYDLVHRIKDHGDWQVVLGGSHVSAIGGEVLERSEADFAIKGEGEETLIALCSMLGESRRDFSRIQGLIWRSKNCVVENGDRPFIENLDALPFPAYEEFPLSKYFCYRNRILPIITSRGCPQRCVFCSVRLSMGRKFRPRNPENVVDEIKYWHNQGWRVFEFQDDNFTCDIDRAKKICDLIVRRNLTIKWCLPNGIRADRLDRELLQKMKESGCFRVGFGIEFTNKDVLRQIKKGTSIERMTKAVEMVRQAGIEVVGFFIVGHPTETYERFMQTLDFARRGPFDRVNFWNLVPYPGTELMEWVREKGVFLCPEEEYLNRISYGEATPIFETPHFSAKESVQTGSFFGKNKFCL